MGITAAFPGVNDRTPDRIEPVSRALVAEVTGRSQSLFARDLEANAAALRDAARSARILVVGAAGSIGGAVVKALTELRPRGLVLVDIDENGLADLVRELRSGSYDVPQDFATSVAGFGSLAFERFLTDAGPFDLVMNFAALKHVRSERDPYSLMRMIETNVLAVDDLVRSATPGVRVFSVSSDKAVRPTSVMGATKRWMERVLAQPGGAVCTSARFANVAFSNGSLLRAFIDRLARRQPIAAPNDVRRYFISHAEAAELCLLAAFLGRHAEVFVPKLDRKRDVLALDEVARRVLAFHGLSAQACASEQEAKSSPLLQEPAPKAWPCYFSASDTSGEKDEEELLLPSEDVDQGRFTAVSVARVEPLGEQVAADARRALAHVAGQPRWSKDEIVGVVAEAVPELAHIERRRSLDDKL